MATCARRSCVSRRLVRCGDRQRVGRRDDDRSRRALCEGTAGAAAAHDGVRRTRRAPQRRGRRPDADGRAQGRAFAKTALAINAEHTSTIKTYFYGERIRRRTTYTAQLWYAAGPPSPKPQ